MEITQITDRRGKRAIIRTTEGDYRNTFLAIPSMGCKTPQATLLLLMR